MGRLDKKQLEEITVHWTKAQVLVSAFVCSMVPDFQDAEDLVQEVAVTIVQEYHRYDRTRPFAPWAMGIAKNKVLMYRRDRLRKGLMMTQDAIEKVAVVYELEHAQFDRMRRALRVCISKIRDRWRQVLEMRYIRKFSTTMIASQLGLTNNAVLITLHRIRLALRDCINRQIGSEEAL
ncbi:MAG: sigma-70 family RNA polymerase sigma factor [Sedimentisphaerales bacterium]|nr:sigma-70 family RNA polymerase sigma factor [Sedimentisphaerales bacterium]